MGAGIAKFIADEYPIALTEDLKTKHGDGTKLGKYTTAHVRKLDGYIVNAYTQFKYGGGVDNFDYGKFEEFMQTINNHAWFFKRTIGFPKIGAGYAKGDWTHILKIIEANSDNLNITIYEL
jgi:O-acetyl-ADP-ribose deacetylase (regulator of RNase III)